MNLTAGSKKGKEISSKLFSGNGLARFKDPVLLRDIEGMSMRPQESAQSHIDIHVAKKHSMIA
jgi:hypothetical protein